MSQHNPIQEQVIAKALKEEAFRQELLGNPKAAIEGALARAMLNVACCPSATGRPPRPS